MVVMDYSKLSDIKPVPSGLLPQWLLLVGSVALLNGIQNIFKPAFSKKVYSSPAGQAQVTPLSARLFAVWNITSAMVRLYAAVYMMCLGTFVIAFVHFTSELIHYGTLSAVPGSMSPMIVASSSVIAMLAQYHYYILS